MEDERDRGSSLIANIFRGIVIAVAFVAASALFAMLLRPLADQRTRPDEGVAIQDAIGTDGARATPTAPGMLAADQTVPPNGPAIAILITEVGADQALGETAIEKLPAPFGIAFLPGQQATRALARKARLDGHEVWVGLPMQPKSWPQVSPGPNTLLVADTAAANAKRLEWALSQVDHPSGAYTMMGSAFTANAQAMAPVAEAMVRHGLVLLDARSIGSTVAASTVAEAGGRALTNDLFIDMDPRPEAINAALDRLVKHAKSHGKAIGIARALPTTIAVLPAWAESLEAKGITLVAPARLAQ